MNNVTQRTTVTVWNLYLIFLSVAHLTKNKAIRGKGESFAILDLYTVPIHRVPFNGLRIKDLKYDLLFSFKNVHNCSSSYSFDLIRN